MTAPVEPSVNPETGPAGHGAAHQSKSTAPQWIAAVSVGAAVLSVLFAGLANLQARAAERSQLRSELRQILFQLEELNGTLEGPSKQMAAANKRLTLLGAADFVMDGLGDDVSAPLLGVLANSHASAGNIDTSIEYFERMIGGTSRPMERSAGLRSLGVMYSAVPGWHDLWRARKNFAEALEVIRNRKDLAALGQRCFVLEHWLAAEREIGDSTGVSGVEAEHRVWQCATVLRNGVPTPDT